MNTIETKATAVWNGDELHTVSHFEWPTPHVREVTMRKVDPTVELRSCYWCAVGGQCFALDGTKDSCIASVQGALKDSGIACNPGWITSDGCYVIFQPKNHTAATWKRWSDKWGKRTALRVS